MSSINVSEEEKQLTQVSANGYPRSSVIGVLGGGQLGRMLALACGNLGVRVQTLDPSPDACARFYTTHVQGSFRNNEDILSFAKTVDILTVEIEHVDTQALEQIRADGKEVQPSPKTIAIIQDKYVQKLHFLSENVPVGDFKNASTEEELEVACAEFGFPLMLKTRRLAYDGRGNFLVDTPASLSHGISQLGGLHQGIYVEKFQAFVKELAVIVVRSRDGQIVPYPLVETIHRDNICHVTEAPANVSKQVEDEALRVAVKAVEALDGAGVFGVEMFLLDDYKTVLINEIAPRPHNTGHYTMDGCVTSQFENHARAILGWPIGDVSLTSKSVIMLNLLGEADGAEGMKIAHEMMRHAYETPGCKVHWYEKCSTSDSVRKNRKLGHINILGKSREETRRKLNLIDPSALISLKKTDRSLISAIPLVAVIMGSDSDLETMSLAAQTLEDDFGIPVEVTIVSAHRTPDRLLTYSKSAHLRGIRVIIAGAGGAAHLPGMVASMTPLPVIGVPVKPHGSHLDGLDALLSIVQMPRGVPVATVAIGNATNAGLLAARILSTADDDLRLKMLAYQQKMARTVLTKADKIEQRGWRDYLVS